MSATMRTVVVVAARAPDAPISSSTPFGYQHEKSYLAVCGVGYWSWRCVAVGWARASKQAAMITCSSWHLASRVGASPSSSLNNLYPYGSTSYLSLYPRFMECKHHND